MTERIDATLRVFYALWPDAAARGALAGLAREIAQRCGGRAATSEKLHVTLAFVGDAPIARIDALTAIGATAARDAAPFALTLERSGGARAGEVAWLAPAAVPDALAHLQAALVAGLDEHGFQTERRAFRPHVTLARRCTRALSRGPQAPISWDVTRLTLIVSEPSAQGPRYRELGAWQLG